jgi:hypothetical protein
MIAHIRDVRDNLALVCRTSTRRAVWMCTAVGIAIYILASNGNTDHQVGQMLAMLLKGLVQSS